MTEKITKGALLLYKQSAAVAETVSDKIEITLLDSKKKKVRPKDVILLHKGPLNSIAKLAGATYNIDLDEIRELLEGEKTSVAEIAELATGEDSPESVWYVFCELRKSDTFTLDGNMAQPLTSEEVEAKRAAKAEKERAEQDWNEYVERIRTNNWTAEDLPHLKELERFALGHSSSNKTLKSLNMPSSTEKAHLLLMKLGIWNQFINPHPVRLNQPLRDPDFEVPEIPNEERLDLTELASFAIDDDGCKDPDDAVSIDGDALWVHVADPAAVVLPDSDIDIEARERGSNAYLPEKMVKMLPHKITEDFGLGLKETSPALSFKIIFDENGIPQCDKIALTTIAAKMISYEEAEKLSSEEPFRSLAKIAETNRARRIANGAFTLNLPEVKVRAKFADDRHPMESELTAEGRNAHPETVEVTPLPPLESREIIAELMIIAGEAVGSFMYENSIPAPFATQPPPEEQPEHLETLSDMFAFRRQLSKTELHTIPSIHSGLGVETYVRITSPLRRYSDLIAHQQLRRFIKNETLLTADEMLERMSLSQIGTSKATMAERQSNQHWKLVYLKEKEAATVKAAVVEIMDNRCKLIIPELAMDAVLRNPGPLNLDQELELKLINVDIPTLEARWKRYM